MLKQVTIKGFKGITDLTLNLDKINVLIGINSSGKTTILQALDLLANCVSRDVSEYLKDKNWKVSDIKSQISKSSLLSYNALFEFEENGNPFLLIWQIEFKLISATSVNLTKESILKVNGKWNKAYCNIDKQQKLFENAIPLYTYRDGIVIYEAFHDQKAKNQESEFYLSLGSSGLKIIDFAGNKDICLLKEFLKHTTNFETLAAENMRRSSRGTTEDIGIGGKQLAAFIKQMNPQQKEDYTKIVHSILNSMDSIDAYTKGTPGWVELFINEKFGSNDIKVRPYHISDGTLRILAFVALLNTQYDLGLLMLDEIENGLNPYITTKIVELLYEFTSQTKHQLLLSTHSSLMLDDFKPEDIIYVYRDNDGRIKAKKVFNTKKIKTFLDYMSPGEIWINLTEKELLEPNDN
ncbi:MAG TPA: ATP-binding protein [Candidatus Cloacimonas sp.]|jgi:predicted ATPase|nr:ATP-binding protein [Candidatus Cloacimonadota bacterium]HOG26989.1 ATP-binding protein [Candidatus Cloacimonas sp.]MDD3734115.1 ATP-binding protein [Candidatus Cloacimonadota bacterium]MDD4676800.1 ATP-binding protein [Candidatus Cloacimonadota bacterium]HOQ77970.1 ATP-binding protein [Candidatus Cloacimonas sp.]